MFLGPFFGLNVGILPFIGYKPILHLKYILKFLSAIHSVSFRVITKEGCVLFWAIFWQTSCLLLSNLFLLKKLLMNLI